MLTGDHPEGDVAEGYHPDHGERAEDELGTRHVSVDVAVRVAGHDDGDDADEGPDEKSAHTTLPSITRGTTGRMSSLFIITLTYTFVNELMIILLLNKPSICDIIQSKFYIPKEENIINGTA